MQKFRLKPTIEFYIILQINLEAIQKTYLKKKFRTNFLRTKNIYKKKIEHKIIKNV